jgi:xanthine dehydrogenase accessory factor
MSFRAKALSLLQREGCVALVTLSRVQGSSPREKGAQMLVAASGFMGSIGGGTLEWQAMAEAQRLLRSPSPQVGRRMERTYSLGPDLGQCCGGRVTVTTLIILDSDVLAQALTPETVPRHIILYGAGHVGKALVLLLAQSPFAITWVDPRPLAFPAATPGNLTKHNDNDVLAPLAHASAGTLVVVLSHSHELDFAVTDAALRIASVAHVLLIGSETKRARFISRLKAAGHAEDSLLRLICPIGDGTLSGKTPYAVALSTAHQLLALDEALALPQRRQDRERQAG